MSKNKMGKILWMCKIDASEVKFLFPTLATFWLQVFESWFTIAKRMGPGWSKSDPLWFNLAIRQRNKPIFDEELFNKGLVTIDDVLIDDRVLTVLEITEKFNASSKMLLINAIYIKVKKVIDSKKGDQENPFCILEKVRNRSKTLYNTYAFNACLLVKYPQKWESILDYEFKESEF